MSRIAEDVAHPAQDCELDRPESHRSRAIPESIHCRAGSGAQSHLWQCVAHLIPRCRGIRRHFIQVRMVDRLEMRVLNFAAITGVPVQVV